MRKTLLILLLTGLCHSLVLKGQLRINEVIAVNTSGKINPLTEASNDWIEIYNDGPERVDMSHYFLSDRRETPFMWMFPENTSIPAKGYLMIWADGMGDTINDLHTNFKLDVAGESLYLFSADRQFVDSLAFPRMYEDVSYGHWGGVYLFLDKPTWKESNLYGEPFEVSGKVIIDPPGGIYSPGIEISIVPAKGSGTIRYTLDGSEPDTNDPEWTGGLRADETMVIRARLYEDRAEPGDVATASYIIHDKFTLPVISLASNPKGFWSDEYGIYVTGTNGIPGNCSNEPRNWNMPWERSVSFEYFDLDGNLQIQFNAGVKIHGGCSRGFNLKSLGIITRNSYGQGSMKYSFFREKNLNEFKGLILRNSGNDFRSTFLRDGVMQAVVHPVMDVDHQAFEPVQVYLNGEYWGIHNLREKVNEHWVTSNYGIPAENLDFLKNGWEVFAGTQEAFNELTAYLEDNSLVYGANYSWVAERVDINSFQDYLISQLFFANTDWPGNNAKYWRDRVNNTKWRWILFDMDFGMGLYDFTPSKNMFEFATEATGTQWPNPASSTLMIRRLFENEAYTEQFVAKYLMHLNTTFAPERVIGIIDSLQMQIYDAYPEHIERWSVPSMTSWENAVEKLRTYSTQRPGFVLENMKNFFSLGSIVNMIVSPTGVKGTISANNIDIPAKGLSGKYTAGSDIDLRFLPAPGYRFSHWEISTGNSSVSTLLEKGSGWKYNDSGVRPENWEGVSYDDSSWPEGTGILGYGDSNESTTLDYGGDEQNKIAAYYFRTSFEIEDLSLFDSFEIGLLRDDGAVIYLNGIEVIRDNMPEGIIGQDTWASDYAGGEEEYTYYRFAVAKEHFQSGLNTIAVEIHQSSSTSSDLSFDLELSGTSITDEGSTEYTQNPLSLNPEGDFSIRAVTEIEELELDLRINEIMASNIGAVLDEYGNDSDWIEVYNNGNTAVDMSGLYMTDDLENPTKWRIPEGSPGETMIGPERHLVFYADENPALGPRHLDFKLSNSGESVGLSYLSGNEVVWIDSISYSKQYANISTGYFPDGDGNWVELDHTPGERNILYTLSVRPKQTLDISLYPNPARDMLNIHISSPDKTLDNQVNIQIYDLTGRKMMSLHCLARGGSISEVLDVSALPGAIYLLVIESHTGTHSIKFVKTDT